MSDSIYLDSLGSEINVGSTVAVPMWQDKSLVFGTVIKLDPFKGDYGVNLHRVEYCFNGEKWTGEWLGKSMIVLNDDHAIMLKLRNFEPVEE